MLKLFLVIFLPLLLFSSLIFSYTYYDGQKDYLNLLKTAENAGFSKLQKKIISENFQHIVSDLLFLAEEHELLALLDGSKEFTHNDLAKDYRSFSLKQRIYDQIRFLDETGQEIIRIDFNNGSPILRPEKQLQNKRNRYYFQETMRLGKGGIFTSPLDLNMEHGKVELPHKPMIRFGTPVFDSSGRKRGIIILNFLGEVLLNNLRSTSAKETREVSLLNSDGYWLISPTQENVWGFMFQDKQDRNIKNLYPKIWQRVYHEEEGQFLSNEGLVTFTTVYPLKEIKTPLNEVGNQEKEVITNKKAPLFWKVIYQIPPEIIDEHSAQKLRWYVSLYLIFILCSFFGCYYVARLYFHRQQTEQALHQSERNLAKAQEIAHVGSWEWDTKSGEIIWSDETYRIFGIQREDIQPTLEIIEKVMSPDDKKEHKRKVNEAVNKTGVFEMEYSINRPDGSNRVVFARGEVVKNRAGEITRLIGSVQDITERKKFEDALKKAHVKLEERVKARTAELASLNKNLEKRVSTEIETRRKQEQLMIQQSKMAAMGEMVSSIAHQWRQPLNGLGLLVQDIQDSYEYKELNQKYIDDTVEKSMGLIQFMSSTIDDFRNFFKPSKEKSLFSVDIAIQEVLTLLSSQLIHHEIKVQTFCDKTEIKNNELDKNTCCEDKESIISGYPNEFKQVLVNIVNNAREAITEKKLKEPDTDKRLTNKIAIKCLRSKEAVVINIKDNAGGIPEKILDRIFEPYFTTKEEGKGTGIGLYMSKVIIEQNMGGSLTVENGKEGAVFTISLKKEDSLKATTNNADGTA